MNRIRNEQGKTTYNRHQKILNISGYFKIPLRKMEKKWKESPVTGPTSDPYQGKAPILDIIIDTMVCL